MNQQMSQEAARPKPRRLTLPLAESRAASGGYTWLSLGAPPDWQSLPGQFVNVLCEDDLEELAASDGRTVEEARGEWDAGEWPRTTGLEIARRWPVARRPFSISRVRRAGDAVRIELLVRGVGRGSELLRSRPVGSGVDVVGPLGTGFARPSEEVLCILVGGGCGMAPLFGLADHLTAWGVQALCFFGAGSVGDMPVEFLVPPRPTREHIEVSASIKEFADDGIPTVLATDDGSGGFHGTAVDAARRYLETMWDGRPIQFYGCGPEAMIRDLAAVAEHRDVPCEVSMERWMGCGAGLCLSCAHKRKNPASETGWTYALTCKQGPVVDARKMVWDTL